MSEPRHLSRTVGVEEELLLVDPDTAEPRAVASAALHRSEGASEDGAGVAGELMQQQVETGTRPCSTIDEVRAELRRWRDAADSSARRAGCRVAALPTSPVPVVPETTPHDRYRKIADEFGITQAEQLACGMHVHVSTDSEEESVGVLDRVRPWLPVLVGLSAGSPFWQGVDTGYASFRSQLWRRWPSAGSPGPFGTPAAYHRLVRDMVDSGGIVDSGMTYFDVRLASDYPTIELRVADVCPRIEVTATIAALCRALVERAAADWRDGTPAPDLPPVMVELMTFRAGRSGLGGDLVHPVHRRPAPAREVVAALLEHVHGPLREYGDDVLVSEVVASLLGDGTAADRHRRLAGDQLDLAAVVRDTIELTAAG